MDDKKISSFTDLKAWQEAHQLALSIYKVVEKFPSSEQFGLSSQLRRVAVSVISNIAEGFGRFHKNDKEHFYVMASGSIYEIKSQLVLGKDLGYIDDKIFSELAKQANIAHKLLHGLLKIHRATEKP